MFEKLSNYNDQPITIRPNGDLYTRNCGFICSSKIEGFRAAVCNTKNCFCCGRPFSEVDHNDEHIIPDWIIRKYDLGKTGYYALPNGQKIPYTRNKIPCCIECNSLLGRVFETPMSAAVEHLEKNATNEEFNKHLELILAWNALTFCKMAIADYYKNWSPDKRLNTGDIATEAGASPADIVNAYTIFKSYLLGIPFPDDLMITCGYFPIGYDDVMGRYDKLQFTPAQTIATRFSNLGFIFVFGDEHITQPFIAHVNESRHNVLSAFQFRELVLRTATYSDAIKHRAKFSLNTCKKKPWAEIRISPQKPEDPIFDPGLFHHIAKHAIAPLEGFFGKSWGTISTQFPRGEISFLFDKYGNVINSYPDG